MPHHATLTRHAIGAVTESAQTLHSLVRAAQELPTRLSAKRPRSVTGAALDVQKRGNARTRLRQSCSSRLGSLRSS